MKPPSFSDSRETAHHISSIAAVVSDSHERHVVILFMGVQIPSPSETMGDADMIDILGHFFDLRDGIEWLRGNVFAEIVFPQRSQILVLAW